MLYGLISGGAMVLCLQFFSPNEGLVIIGVAGLVGVVYATGVARHERSWLHASSPSQIAMTP